MRSPSHKNTSAADKTEDSRARAEVLLSTPPGITRATLLSSSSPKVGEGAKAGSRVESDDPREGRGQPTSLPKGMTGQLMRQVAALDVTRMSCQQASIRTEGGVIEPSAVADVGGRARRSDVQYSGAPFPALCHNETVLFSFADNAMVRR